MKVRDKKNIYSRDAVSTEVNLKSGSFELGAADIKIKGHHLSVKMKGHEYESILPGTPWHEDSGGNGTVYMPKMGPLQKRVISHGNAGEHSGLTDTFMAPVDGAAPLVIDSFTNIVETDSIRYLSIPNVTYILYSVYYKLAMTLAELQAHPGVRLRGYYANIQKSDLETDEINETKLYDDVQFIDVERRPSQITASGASIFSNLGEILIGDIGEVDYPEGQVITFWITSLTKGANFKLYMNADATLPWRAVDIIEESHMALVPVSLVYPKVNITSPVANSVGQSLTPTFTVVKDSPIAGEQLDFTLQKTRFSVYNKETQNRLIDTTVSAATYDVPVDKKLSGSTQYQVEATPITHDDIPLQRTSRLTFTTTFEVSININTIVVRNGVTLNLAAGDLIELKIGESVNAVGYNFHVSGQTVEFPPAAYTSGSFRFKDILGTDLNFMVNAVTGTTPNRTATIYIEVNAQVVSDAQLVLTEGV